MSDIKNSAYTKIKENDKRLNTWKELIDEQQADKSAFVRFHAACALAEYIPVSEGTKLFRYDELVFSEKKRLKKRIIAEKTEEYVFEMETEIRQIDSAYDRGSCMSDVYRPEKYVRLRELMMTLLEKVGCSYWDYYDNYLRARGYEYSTPIMDLAYVCRDLSRVYFLSLDKVVKAKTFYDRSLSLRKSLIKISDEMVSLDTFAFQNYFEDEEGSHLLNNMKKIHDYAHRKHDIGCLFELDHLYSSLVVIYVMSAALDGRLDEVPLDFQQLYNAGERNDIGNLNNVLDAAQNSMREAMGQINRIFSCT